MKITTPEEMSVRIYKRLLKHCIEEDYLEEAIAHAESSSKEPKSFPVLNADGSYTFRKLVGNVTDILSEGGGLSHFRVAFNASYRLLMEKQYFNDYMTDFLDSLSNGDSDE